VLSSPHLAAVADAPATHPRTVVVTDERVCTALVAALDRLAEVPRRLHAIPEVDSLTPREREVLCLLAEGLSTTDIARRLFVSPATVKSHVERVLTKLRARDRLQAVVVAFRSGLVS
jgi:DNA-binding NarL/FixJ family response regulator